MYICVDFDGTCVTHEYPNVGKEIGAVPVLKKLVAHGHKLILFTMRSNLEEGHKSNDGEIIPMPKGNYLDDAVNWFKENGIELYGINTNPTQKDWTSSPKAYGHLYIDDAALGTPLIVPWKEDRPYVDWKEVERMLIQKGVLYA